MKFLNSPILTLVTLALFLTLAAHSTKHVPAGRVTDATNFINAKLAAYHPSSNTLQQKQATTLKNLWNITEADLDKPINLWSNK